MKKLQIVVGNKCIELSTVKSKNEGWITVHPNGKDKKGRRIKLEKGESLGDALARTTGKPKEAFDKFKDAHPQSKSLEELRTGKASAEPKAKAQTEKPAFSMKAAKQYIKDYGIDITPEELKQAKKENNDVWQLMKQVHEGADKLSFEDGGVGEKDIMEAVEVMRLKANKDPFGRSLEGKDIFGRKLEKQLGAIDSTHRDDSGDLAEHLQARKDHDAEYEAAQKAKEEVRQKVEKINKEAQPYMDIMNKYGRKSKKYQDAQAKYREITKDVDDMEREVFAKYEDVYQKHKDYERNKDHVTNRFKEFAEFYDLPITGAEAFTIMGVTKDTEGKRELYEAWKELDAKENMTKGEAKEGAQRIREALEKIASEKGAADKANADKVEAEKKAQEQREAEEKAEKEREYQEYGQYTNRENKHYQDKVNRAQKEYDKAVKQHGEESILTQARKALLDEMKANKAKVIEEYRKKDQQTAKSSDEIREMMKKAGSQAEHSKLRRTLAEALMREAKPVEDNPFEERVEARRDYYAQKAHDLSARARESGAQVEKEMGLIPFGQPYAGSAERMRADTNYRNKLGSRMKKSVEEGAKAGYYADKAQTYQTHGIRADDPDAIYKLKEKYDHAKNSAEERRIISRILQIDATRRANTTEKFSPEREAQLAESGITAKRLLDRNRLAVKFDRRLTPEEYQKVVHNLGFRPSRKVRGTFLKPLSGGTEEDLDDLLKVLKK